MPSHTSVMKTSKIGWGFTKEDLYDGDFAEPLQQIKTPLFLISLNSHSKTGEPNENNNDESRKKLFNHWIYERSQPTSQLPKLF
jgi:hypothetical protein